MTFSDVTALSATKQTFENFQYLQVPESAKKLTPRVYSLVTRPTPTGGAVFIDCKPDRKGVTLVR